MKNCRKGSHIVIRYKWVTNKWTDKEGKERSVNEPRINSLKPPMDTHAPQPQQKAYDPWNSQPTKFEANNGFDNPPL